MRNKNTYILFVFAIHDDPDSFVSLIGKELSLLAMSPDVKYYYGDQASIFTFSSMVNFKDMSEMLDIMLGQDKITYMFLPLDKNKMFSSFGKVIEEHLFGEEPETSPKNISINSKMREMFENMNRELMDDEDEDNEIERMRCEPEEPSVNDILDKIKLKGIKSLTEKERNILDNYSKQL